MEMKMPVHVMKRGGSPEEASWRARVTGNPLRDAFDPKIMTHAGMSASLVPDEELAVRIEEIADTVRGRRTVAYINVPYCETRCLYCLFYIKPYRNAEESRAFTDLLIRELELWNKRNVQTGRPLEAVYFGGGTPTALEASDIVRLIRAVKKNLPLANDCEITFEGRLSNFGPDRMEACMEGGTNRFSLGVQTFDTKIRQAVGRRSTKEELVRQLERLTGYNQAAVVVDLIYGFPYQTLETWKEDLRMVAELGLDGADCYQLRVFPGAPLYRYIEKGKLPAGPDSEMRGLMFAESIRAMEASHWKRLSISHWARATRERNFYNYFAKGRTDCLAFGPGAGGTVSGYGYMVNRNVDEWKASVAAGEKPVAMITAPGRVWNEARALNEQTELNYLDPAALERLYPIAFSELWRPAIENWLEAGLIEPDGSRYQLTVSGQFWQGRLTQALMDLLASASK